MSAGRRLMPNHRPIPSGLIASVFFVYRIQLPAGHGARRRADPGGGGDLTAKASANRAADRRSVGPTARFVMERTCHALVLGATVAAKREGCMRRTSSTAPHSLTRLGRR